MQIDPEITLRHVELTEADEELIREGIADLDEAGSIRPSGSSWSLLGGSGRGPTRSLHEHWDPSGSRVYGSITERRRVKPSPGLLADILRLYLLQHPSCTGEDIDHACLLVKIVAAGRSGALRLPGQTTAGTLSARLET
jgi:hypothetical protein